MLPKSSAGGAARVSLQRLMPLHLELLYRTKGGWQADALAI
jgi:hypothetical protein